MDLAMKYGGRAGGAYLAWRFLGKSVGGGMVGTAAVLALGWVAGGLVADQIAAKVG